MQRGDQYPTGGRFVGQRGESVLWISYGDEAEFAEMCAQFDRRYPERGHALKTVEDLIAAFQVALNEAGLVPYLAWAEHEATLSATGVRVEWKLTICPRMTGGETERADGETYEECLGKALALIPWLSRELQSEAVGYDPVALGC